VQYSILESGLQYSSHPKAAAPGGHSMGPNVTTIGSEPSPGSVYTRRITFYRNYIAHNNARNIRALPNRPRHRLAAAEGAEIQRRRCEPLGDGRASRCLAHRG
jgi:hypothetical protein